MSGAKPSERAETGPMSADRGCHLVAPARPLHHPWSVASSPDRLATFDGPTISISVATREPYALHNAAVAALPDLMGIRPIAD